MAKKIIVLSVLLFLLFPFGGCRPKIVRTELDRLYEKGFAGLDIPEVEKIRAEGKNKSFDYATFDEVWDSAVIVLMQVGFIVRTSKDTGIIVVVPPQRIKTEKHTWGATNYYNVGLLPLLDPVALFVEEGERITVYFRFIENLNRRVDKPEEKVGFAADEKMIAEAFWEMLAVQVYAGQKWKYLYKESKD